MFGCGAFLAGAALAARGGAGIRSLAGAGFPSALAHGSGGAVAAVFALGLIESGAVAILTISASTAYSAGECAGAAHSFNSPPRTAMLFYGANITVTLIARLRRHAGRPTRRVDPQGHRAPGRGL